ARWAPVGWSQGWLSRQVAPTSRPAQPAQPAATAIPATTPPAPTAPPIAAPLTPVPPSAVPAAAVAVPAPATGQPDPRFAVLESHVADYFAALNNQDYAGAQAACCTPHW